MKLLLLVISIFCAPFLWAQVEQMEFSLYFENDKSQLTQAHIFILDSIKKLHHKDQLDIHIKGYTNTVGEEHYNLALSKDRAANVTKNLREFTIISSQGYGELDSDSKTNRRVDIFIHLKKYHVKVPGEIVLKPTQKGIPPEYAKVFRAGDKITIEGIRFYQDRDIMLNESKKALKKLLTFIQQYPKMTFKLIGHICCGDPENPGIDFTNLRTGKKNLSEARAQYVYNYLIKKGINKNRMSYKGMAFRQPLGKRSNNDRRVEIEIISFND